MQVLLVPLQLGRGLPLNVAEPDVVAIRFSGWSGRDNSSCTELNTFTESGGRRLQCPLPALCLLSMRCSVLCFAV